MGRNQKIRRNRKIKNNHFNSVEFKNDKHDFSQFKFSITDINNENQYILKSPLFCSIFYYDGCKLEMLSDIEMQVTIFDLNLQRMTKLFCSQNPLPGYYLINHITKKLNCVLTHVGEQSRKEIWNEVAKLLDGKFLSVERNEIVSDYPPISLLSLEDDDELRNDALEFFTDDIHYKNAVKMMFDKE